MRVCGFLFTSLSSLGEGVSQLNSLLGACMCVCPSYSTWPVAMSLCPSCCVSSPLATVAPGHHRPGRDIYTSTQSLKKVPFQRSPECDWSTLDHRASIPRRPQPCVTSTNVPGLGEAECFRFGFANVGLSPSDSFQMKLNLSVHLHGGDFRTKNVQ